VVIINNLKRASKGDIYLDADKKCKDGEAYFLEYK
jgi:hypothetical protein